jgi:signal transduction histidine kinase
VSATLRQAGGRHPELVAAGVGLAGAVACALVEGPQAGVATVPAFAVVGVPAILVARAAGRQRARFGSVRRRLAFAVALALVQLFVTTAVFVAVMFFSAHDAVLVAVLVSFCAAVAYVAVREMAEAPLAALDAVRDGLDDVAAGRRDVRLAVNGDDELAALADATNRMVDRLAASEDARRSLVAAVSHDLRTPITSLRLLSEAIGDGVVPADARREYLARMRVHLDALSALIDDLFELSRLEAGEIAWSMHKVDLAMIVNETVDAMAPQAEAGRVAVRCRVPPDLALARADPERLQRVLFNLIQNAIRHTPADGSVTVLAQLKGDAVEIEVADTGEGIAPADRDSVFEAFFQGGRRAARSEGGAGLGLAISRAIVEAHGGRIWLAETERGTRVRFSLSAAG